MVGSAVVRDVMVVTMVKILHRNRLVHMDVYMIFQQYKPPVDIQCNK